MLATQAMGTGEPVVLIHGFTQSGRSWTPIADQLARTHRVVLVDAPGHGGSAGVEVGLEAGARMIGDAGGRAAYAGYSMGGRFALRLALARPDRVTRLALLSTTAGIDDAAVRAERRRADEALALQIERDGVKAFVGWWLQRPLFATLPPAASAMESRLDNTVAGLASSLRLAGTGTQPPLWDQLSRLEMPVLVVAGQRDEAYLQRAHRIVDGIGANARLLVVAGAGHAVHLEAPQVISAAMAEFLA